MENNKKFSNKQNQKLDEKISSSVLLSEDTNKLKLKNEKEKLKKKKTKQAFVKKVKHKIDSTVQETKEIVKEHKTELTFSLSKKVEDAKIDVKKKSTRPQIYFYIFCLLINIFCFSFILFMLSSWTRNLSDVLNDGNKWWFALAFLSFGVIAVLDSLFITSLLKGASKKYKFTLSYKTWAVGRYYDCITPFKTGGQAFQIAYLHKFGERGHSSASVPITRFVVNQFVYLTVIVILLFNIGKVKFETGVSSSIISVLAYVGLALQFLWLLTILFLSYSKRIGPVCVIGVLKFLSWIRIVKDYRKAYVRVLKFVKEYQLTMKRCLNNFGRFIFIVFCSTTCLVLKWSLPWFLYCGLNGFDGTLFLPMFAYAMIIELALGFWILPGNVVFADLVFIALFKNVFGSAVIFWALLFWRLISYYFYIVQGVSVKLFDTIKYKWCKQPYIKSSNINKKEQIVEK